ncbi:uncharacterized protein LOC131211698 [Anopheles bellator]|uniref:uncharacterized protein LOC131211698 n=1 Tax=Anopheles bellator TaxID=139047 RepID=UPI0026493E1E|nr:uncharacterized protein LOC131211698 [Anopheles bellator]
MIPCKCIVLLLVIVAIMANKGQGRSIERSKRDVVADGMAFQVSASAEDSRSSIPVISDIQRVEKIADLVISIGEQVIPVLLNNLAEQVTSGDRKLSRHAEKPSPGRVM